VPRVTRIAAIMRRFAQNRDWIDAQIAPTWR
jgi:hypothetical protein